MITYILKTVLCSSLFLTVYAILLQQEKTYRFNRFYLLLSIVASLVIPLISIHLPIANSSFIATEPVKSNTTLLAITNFIEEDANIQPIDNNNIVDNEWNWNAVALTFFSVVSSYLLLKFIYNFVHLQLLAKKHEKQQFKNALLVKLPQAIVPFSFFQYIFVPKQSELEINEAILKHELAHVQQKHSLDILFIELILTVCWINPIFFLYKKAIQLNHEFLADEAVLKQSNNKMNYQYLLLQNCSRNAAFMFTSSFNYLFTKKRLLMMNKKFTGKQSTLKLVATMCIVTIVTLAFIAKITAKTTNYQFPNTQTAIDTTEPIISYDKTLTTSEKKALIKKYQHRFYFVSGRIPPHTEKGVSAAVLEQYQNIVKKIFVDSLKKRVNHDNLNVEDLQTLKSIFIRMNMEQQLQQNVGFMYPFPPKKTGNKPTPTQIETWKNAKKYGIWIDEKRVNNEVLNKYSASDFSDYYASQLSKNAINYGKHYVQIDLSTNAYFKKQYQESLKRKDSLNMYTWFMSKPTKKK